MKTSYGPGTDSVSVFKVKHHMGAKYQGSFDVWK